MGVVALQLSSLLSNSKFTVRNLVLGCTTLGGSSSDPPPFPPPDPTFSPFSSFRNDGSDADHAICHAFLSKILGESFINSRGGKLALKRLTSKFIESRLSHVGDVAAGINNQLSALSRFDGVDMLKSIKTNTNTNIVIIHGTEDEIIPYENATLMKRICDSNKNNDDNGTERSSLIKMENESHFFFITNAIKTCDEVNRAMK